MPGLPLREQSLGNATRATRSRHRADAVAHLRLQGPDQTMTLGIDRWPRLGMRLSPHYGATARWRRYTAGLFLVFRLRGTSTRRGAGHGRFPSRNLPSGIVKTEGRGRSRRPIYPVAPMAIQGVLEMRIADFVARRNRMGESSIVSKCATGRVTREYQRGNPIDRVPDPKRAVIGRIHTNSNTKGNRSNVDRDRGACGETSE